MSSLSFSYEAQTLEGRAMRGTIDAADLDDATHQLHSMGLRVLAARAVETTSADPATMTAETASEPLRVLRVPRGTLGADDFRAFNDQLAHLAAAGLPVEHGLRMLAQDLRRGRLADVVRAVAAEIDRGTPLHEAIEKHRGQFPPLYARLIDAGSRTGDLSAALLNIGRHVDTVQRLRRNVWRASAYPLVVALAICIVLLILSWLVFPQFEAMYYGVGHSHARPPTGGWSATRSLGIGRLPLITEMLFVVGRFARWGLLAAVAALVLIPLAWRIAQQSRIGPTLNDVILLRIPLIGPAIRASLLARWCDALRVGVNAGLDLPDALSLAADTIDSPGLRRDTLRLIAAVERGQPLDDAHVGRPIMLPSMVAPMLELAARGSDLPLALRALGELYQRQAETRVRAIPGVLGPILMAIVAVTITLVLIGLLLPLARIFNYLMVF